MATDLTKYKLNHTMIRVKDPERSIKFYTFLGMRLIHKRSMPEANFDLYFLGYDAPSTDSDAVSSNNDNNNDGDTSPSFTTREGLIELTHNHGTEHDAAFSVNTGNQEPHRGFGHTCISVDHMQAACARIEGAGYRFQKRYTDGRMRSVAFVLDPDGYWVEIIAQKAVEETEHVTTTDLRTYRMNHTMLRVKDADKSLRFYQDVLGLSLTRTIEQKEAGFNLYFLAYTQGPPPPASEASATQAAGQPHPNCLRQAILELTWNYGTEKDEAFAYHSGNDEPQGFGHICVSVDDIDAACKRFDELNVRWQKRLTDGRMHDVAFILDPDGYWIEIIENDAGKKQKS